MAANALPLASRAEPAGLRFAMTACLVAATAALWTSLAPLQASVWTVFLFAGPHNWMEARYFLARMPVQWAASRRFFTVALSGVALLAVAQALLYEAPGMLPAWNAALCLWIAWLWMLRARELGRDAFGALPVAFAAAAVGVEWPVAFSLALVYLHPLVALWFLDRQIRVSRPEWLPAWRQSIWLLPVLLAGMIWQLAGAPALANDDPVAFAITRHAGAGILAQVSSHMLVSMHVFLETLHYGVWLLAIPLLGMRSRPWDWAAIPLLRHRAGWPRLIKLILLGGAGAALLLWACFLLDYATTRQVYFTIAVVHVLAEIPFLMRLR